MLDEQWQVFGREVEAHLTRIDDELGALRDTLRRAGINVRRQRVRVTRANGKARDALTVLRQEAQSGASLSPAALGLRVGVSAEYAYDLLMALVASGAAERVARGRYRATADPGE